MSAKSITWDAAPSRPGVYLSLPHELYLQIEALGSGDHRQLYVDPASWWWESRYNPLRPADVETDAKRMGAAGHMGLLEGVRAYEKAFHVHPERDLYRGLLETTDDLQDWLRRRGLKVSGTKPKLIERVREADAAVPIWDEILREFHRRRGARGWVTEAEDARIRLMRRVLEAMPDLHRALKAGLSEVSVVWEDEVSGHLCRTRFDRITPRAIFELKLFARREDMKLREAALASAARLRQHMQAALHMEGYDRLVEFVSRGDVYGGTARQRRALDKIAAGDPQFRWLFYPSNGTPTPEVIPLKRDGLVMHEGEKNLAEARMNFRAWHATYGLDRMWISATRPREVDDDSEGFLFWRTL